MLNQLSITRAITALLVIGFLPAQAAEKVLTLDMAVKAAQQYDPWLAGNQHTQSAINAMSIAAGTLPDPKVSLGLANLPLDGLNFSQEAMSQVKIGVSQMFPRGDSLKIRQKQLQQLGSQYPFQRQDRRAKVAVTASHLWLDAYKAEQSIILIENNRALFAQLADVAQASYASAIGKTQQQDIVRAQLELTRLEDRLTVLQQQQEMHHQQLLQWSGNYFAQEYTNKQQLSVSANMTLTQQLPDTQLLKPKLITATAQSRETLYSHFSQHPAVKAIEQKIKASSSGITLAKQQYQPEWGVNASYGHRNDTPQGDSRADFFSVGVTFDIPLFTANRQDQQMRSAVSTTEAVKTEKWLLLRQLMSGFDTARVKLLRLKQRQALYQAQLLPQTHEQAEASLTAYTNDAGDFAEVVRARIAELNAQIDALGIAVDKQKALIQLNYYFTASTADKNQGETK